MTARIAVAFTCALFGTGCITKPLQRNTLKQVSTLSDVYEQQVLNNLAMIHANPSAIPSFAIPAGGVVNVQDQASGLLVVQGTGRKLAFDKSGPVFGANRTINGNWSLAPVNDPDRLKLMRSLYRQAIGCVADSECDHDREELEQFFGPEWASCAAPTGWLSGGCKKDVPKDACAVGHYGDHYVWVMAEGRDALARITLSTLDIATVLFVHPPPPSKEITTFHYHGDVLRSQEKRVIVDPLPMQRKKPLTDSDLKGLRNLTPEQLPSAGRPEQRLNYFDPYRGLFFTPR